MNMKRMKWIATIFTILFIGVFEFIRHHFLNFISMSWGNLLVAVTAGLLFYIYFHGLFSLLDKTYNKLRKEQEERAVLQERDRIARELHDNVSQALFFMNIKVMEIETALQQHKSLAAVRELKEAIRLTDGDIRQNIFELQKVAQQNINLVASIQEYLTHYEEQNGIKVSLHITGDSDSKLSYQAKKQIIRISQELLFNIRKHAQAESVHVSLMEDDHEFSMIIQDDGKGFDIEDLQTRQSSFGYKNVENDARGMGANLIVESVPDKGTRIILSLNFK